SFSAAAASLEVEAAPAAEIEWGVGNWLATALLASLRRSLRISIAGGLVCAAHGPRPTSNITKETARARSIILVGVAARGSPRNFRFPSFTLASRIQLSYLLWRPYCWLPCSPEPLSCLGFRPFCCGAFLPPRKWM